MTTRKKRLASAARVNAAFLELWRRSMHGDAEALDALLPEALKLDPAEAQAGAARRMVLRALQQASRQLQARADSSPEPEASRLREAARRRFYQAVLARHVNLQAAASTASLFAPAAPPVTALPIPAAAADLARRGAAEPAPAEPECLLDPPPDAPGEMMAANVPLLPLGGGAVGSTSVKLHWEIPDNHGKDITSYTVSVHPKPLACTIQYSANSAVVTGLLAGTYNFQVIATNGDGPSVPSAPSNPVSVTDLPAAQVPAVRARSSGSLAAVEWDAPPAPAVTEYWLVVYDAATPGRVVARKRVSGQSLSTAFSGLPKGSYTFSVRAFAKGGFGDETLSAALAFTPAPTPFDAATKPFSADSLLHFNLGNSGLHPDDLVKRLTGAMSAAGKWRFDYLKSLAVQSVNNTVAYEQQIAQLMQMAVSKVSTAQLLLSPVLQQVLTTIKGEVQDLKSLATSDTVQGIVKQVGEAAATATSLEGLITFLMDKSPFDFWVGLFEGLICDIACFDTGMNRTEAFLKDYFNKLGEELKEYIRGLVIRVEQTIDALAGPLRAAISDIVSGTSKALDDTMKAFGDPPLLQAVAPGNGELLPGGNPFAPVDKVLKNLDQTLTDVIQAIKDAIKTTLNNALDGEGLLIKLVKAFIVYPILGILVISFAGGFIAAGVIAAVVLALGIELLRLVARWLAGPLLDVLADAKQKVVDILNQLKGVFEKQLALLDNPADNLQLVSGSLAELRALLPQAFLTEAAALLGDARRALLQNTSSLALAAERALGLEHCTAFDVITGTYKRQVAPAPQLPGGSDDTYLGGAAMLRDLNLLETQRTRLTDGKEVVMTQRLSLFRLLGGVGDPAAATGEVQKAMNELFSGGRIIVKLSEELLIDRNFPGLYRVLIDDIQPRGVIGAAFTKAQHLLPMTIPLTLTHLGPARTRIRRDGNLAAPPLELSRMLQRPAKDLVTDVFSSGGPVGASSLQKVVEDAVDAALATLGNFDFGPARVRVQGFFSDHALNSGAPSSWLDYLYVSTDEEFQRLRGDTAKWGYGYSGERFQGLAKAVTGAIPIYRKRRKLDRLTDGWADHFFTPDQNEASADYDNEGLVFYAFPPGFGAIPGLITFNRYRNLRYPGHLLSDTQPQKDGKDDPDWAIDGPLFSAFKAYSSPPAFLDAIPAAASIAGQLRAALMANLPAAVATWLSEVTDGLVPQAASAGTVRGITQWVFDSIDPAKGGKGKPLSECAFDIKAGATVCPTRAVTRAEILALLNGTTLANGIVPDVTKAPLLPGLANLVVIEHAAQLSAQSLSIAKWAGSTITEDRDPHIRSLGFVTLEQKLTPESMIFNLLPDPTPVAGGLSQPGVTPAGVLPTTSLSALQYRPFENRPFDTEFLLSLDAQLPLGALSDLLFEVRVRACFDENLAAAVKASRAQRSGILDQANALAGGANKILRLPNTLALRDFSSAATRTFNFSLRAHHDNLVQLATAAVQAIDGTSVAKPLLDLTGLAPLGSMEPLKPLKLSNGSMLTSIALQFQKQRPDSLDALASLIPVTPEDFGFSVQQLGETLLNNILGSDAGELSGIGVAIVPALDPATPDAQRKFETIRAEIENVVARIDPLLGGLLPDLVDAAGADKLVRSRLMMTDPSQPTKVAWNTLWNKAQLAATDAVPKLLAKPAPGDAVPPFIQLELGDALKNGHIYDVIFSISSKIPVRLLNPASAIS